MTGATGVAADVVGPAAVVFVGAVAAELQQHAVVELQLRPGVAAAVVAAGDGSESCSGDSAYHDALAAVVEVAAQRSMVVYHPCVEPSLAAAARPGQLAMRMLHVLACSGARAGQDAAGWVPDWAVWTQLHRWRSHCLRPCCASVLLLAVVVVAVFCVD